MAQSGRKVLVIDDDVLVRQSIVAYLDDSGYLVHDESNGASGIVWFKRHKPDLVLTDLRMPDMDGLSILRQVKAIDPDIPVIVVSGMGMVADVAEALRLGAADYLVKPLVDMEVLVHSIAKALEVLDLQRQNKRYRQELEKANRGLQEYVRVLERDQQAGRQVQRNLLPDTPADFDNVTISHRIVPSLYLSGDFVDYGLSKDRYLSFYLTDVSGHGASSAFVTVWLKLLVRRLFDEHQVDNQDESDTFQLDLAALMSLVNKEMMASSFGCHLTCFVAVLDLHTGEMRYVVGGHLPLPVLVSGDKARFLEGKGKPIGMFEDAEWEVMSLTVPEDFALVAFSDGVLEILPPKDLIDKEQKLLDLLADTKGDIETVCERLSLKERTNSPDDIAILCLQSKGLRDKEDV